jgi:protoheme IX farnesyltransferase
MSTVKSTQAEPVAIPVRTATVGKLSDYLELTKPRIAVLALFTVTVGYSLGSQGNWHLVPLVHALCGIALVAAGSSALNAWLERNTDALMERTATRPLPDGRLQPREVLAFGLVTGIVGCLYLLVTTNWLTAALASATLLIYAALYTPLKRTTSYCTVVGAVAGALPPVLGWTAAGGTLDAGALALFAIMFLWQFPHFVAIAWLYREDYARAGLKMLPAAATSPRITGSICVAYALALLPVSLLPSRVGLAGNGYFLAAVVLGAGYALCAARFFAHESPRTARHVIYSSLLYLPLLLLLLTWDHYQLLR